MTLADATVNSVNTVYAQAIAQVGPERVAELAKRMGVERDLEPTLSIALGTEEVTPLELATVFSTFSRSGKRIDPFTVTKIETRQGDVLFERSEPEEQDALDPSVADTVSAILSETPRRGTARRAALDRPMAAKTGTTQNNADAWLAGYTPEYTAIVWLGYPDGNQPMDTVDDIRVQGGSIPAMIWHDFMAEALSDVEPTEFPEPDRRLLGEGEGRESEFVVTTTTTRPDDTSTTSSTSSTSSTTSTTEPDEDEEEDDTTSTTTTSAPATTTTAPPDEEEQTAPTTTAATAGT
jgi:penicillin-binding protein 1A